MVSTTYFFHDIDCHRNSYEDSKYSIPRNNAVALVFLLVVFIWVYFSWTVCSEKITLKNIVLLVILPLKMGLRVSGNTVLSVEEVTLCSSGLQKNVCTVVRA